MCIGMLIHTFFFPLFVPLQQALLTLLLRYLRNVGSFVGCTRRCDCYLFECILMCLDIALHLHTTFYFLT